MDANQERKSDSRILYQRLKDVALRFGKSKRFEKWLKSQHPDKSWHHVFGSTMGRKSCDYLSIMTDGEEHAKGQKDMDWLIAQMPEALNNLLRYVTELENRE